MMLFIGSDIPNSKVKSAPDLKGVKYRKLKTRFIRLGSRVLPWHLGLVRELRKFEPDAIVCEGESHFLGYLQAIWYRLVFNRRVALIHWCFISLPGWASVGGRGFRALVKRFFRKFFDAFIVYSSFSKECLLKLGQPSEKVFVATNVSDTRKFLELSALISESASEARKRVNLPDRFSVLYLGTLDENKRPGLMLDLAAKSKRCDYNFILLGSGPLLDEFRERVGREHLENVFLLGRVAENLHHYLRAADVLLVPGRGGIIISEAMAFGLPVGVHQADGTEYDLVQNGVTGFHLSSNRVDDFFVVIEFLRSNPRLCSKMGRVASQLIENRFSTENMVEQIKKAAYFANKAK